MQEYSIQEAGVHYSRSRRQYSRSRRQYLFVKRSDSIQIKRYSSKERFTIQGILLQQLAHAISQKGFIHYTVQQLYCQRSDLYSGQILVYYTGIIYTLRKKSTASLTLAYKFKKHFVKRNAQCHPFFCFLFLLHVKRFT